MSKPTAENIRKSNLLDQIHKRTPELKWFDPANYDSVEYFDKSQWHNELIVRNLMYSLPPSEICPKSEYIWGRPGEREEHTQIHDYHSSKLPGKTNLIGNWHHLTSTVTELSDPIVENSISQVQALENIVLTISATASEVLGSPTVLNVKLLKQITQARKVINAALHIDTTAADESVKFLTIKNNNREDGSHGNNLSLSLLKEWHQIGLLPYLDILQWMQLTGRVRFPADIAELIYLEDVADKSQQLRQTTRKHARNITSYLRLLGLG